MPERIVHDADGCSVVVATTNTGAAEVYAGCFWQGVSKGADVCDGPVHKCHGATTATAATNTGAADVWE